jgi:hypothetical protein
VLRQVPSVGVRGLPYVAAAATEALNTLWTRLLPKLPFAAVSGPLLWAKK